MRFEFRFRLAFIAVIVVIICVFFEFRSESIKCFLRYLLESDLLFKLLSFYVIPVVVTYGINVPGDILEDIPVFRLQLTKPIDIALNLGTFMAMSRTGASLLEGTYMEIFFGKDKQYFAEFDKLDVYVLMGLAWFLLWYVIFQTTMMVKVAWNYTPPLIRTRDGRTENDGNTTENNFWTAIIQPIRRMFPGILAARTNRTVLHNDENENIDNTTENDR